MYDKECCTNMEYQLRLIIYVVIKDAVQIRSTN